MLQNVPLVHQGIQRRYGKILNRKDMKKNNSLVAFGGSVNLTKESQATLAENLVAQVVNGSVDSVAAFLQIKAIAEVCDQFLKNSEICDAVQKAVVVRGKDASFCGGKIGLSSTTRYDFASSGDSQYLDLIKQQEEIKNKIKAREMYLKAISEEQDILDSNSGKIIHIVPPTKNVSQSLRVTFDKV